MFQALVLEKNAEGQAVAAIREMDDSALPAGDVTVAVEYSTVNYKDGLCLSPTGSGLVMAVIGRVQRAMPVRRSVTVIMPEWLTAKTSPR